MAHSIYKLKGLAGQLWQTDSTLGRLEEEIEKSDFSGSSVKGFPIVKDSAT